MSKVMIKDCIKAAIEYNKGMISTERFCSILSEYDESHKLVMLYDMDKDSDNESMVTKLYLIDTNNHYRTVRTVWNAVEESKMAMEDVVEAVEQFNDEMIDVCDLNDVKNQYDKQHDSKITFQYNKDGKVSDICLIIANGLIKRTIWEIKGQDIEKRFEKYVLNHVKNTPIIGKGPRSFCINEDITIRMIPLVCGYIAYERLNSDGIAENTIILNREGKRLTKPRLWQLCDYITASIEVEGSLCVINTVIEYYNATRRRKLSARIYKGKIIISRHDKDNKTRVVYGGVTNG